MKSQVSYVAVNRAEGPCEETGAVVFHSGDTTPTDYDDGHHHYRGAKVVKVAPGEIAWAVLHQFFLWGQTAPENGGYDKCDFKVMWDNGECYEGRFDLVRGGTEGDQTFWTSLRDRVSYYACVRRPAHFNDKCWDQHCRMMDEEGCRVSAKKMMDECEMG